MSRGKWVSGATPGKPGVYKTRRPDQPTSAEYYSKWTGQHWCFDSSDVEDAEEMNIPSTYQSREWFSEHKDAGYDFTLLRKFDLEAAKRGEAVCWYADGDTLRYVGAACNIDSIGCFEWLEGKHKGRFESYPANFLRMAPLCWVEGKPVYKGDTLYGTGSCKGLTYVAASFNEQRVLVSEAGTSGCVEQPEQLTWTKQARKVKKEGWVNVYRDTSNSFHPAMRVDIYPYHTEALAKQRAGSNAVACVKIEYEIEE